MTRDLALYIVGSIGVSMLAGATAAAAARKTWIGIAIAGFWLTIAAATAPEPPKPQPRPAIIPHYTVPPAEPDLPPNWPRA